MANLSVAGLIAAGQSQTDNPVPTGIIDAGGISRAITGSTSGDINVQGHVADGIALTQNSIAIGGKAGSNAQTIGANTAGQLFVLTEGQKATYSCAINAHAPAATPTDWFTIQGSASKTVRITRLTIAFRATAGNQYRASLIKYSVFLTGGTPATPTIVPHDSANVAATAVIQTWAGGLPTPGIPVGKIADDSIPVGALGTPIYDNQTCMYDFGIRNGQSIVLHGIAQYLAINSAGVALPAGLVADVRVEWTED